MCRIDGATAINHGDSGTAIVAEDDNALLGILYAKSLASAYFCKLKPELF